jgi:hypothetical protein
MRNGLLQFAEFPFQEISLTTINAFKASRASPPHAAMA